MMLRPTRSWTAVVGLAVALAISTPALANAQSAGHSSRAVVGANNRIGAAAVHYTAGSASAAGTAARPTKATPRTVHPYPSATSTVVGSVGFIDDTQIGYFWSASRGDSVTQTFNAPPPKVKRVILKLNVPDNSLVTGAEVDWTVSINGTDVGSFVVSPGQTGNFNVHFTFPKIVAASYTVKMRVTNEVPAGGGSITLAYAGTGWHVVKLKAS